MPIEIINSITHLAVNDVVHTAASVVSSIPVSAASSVPESVASSVRSVNWTHTVTWLLGGMCIFLFGLDWLSSSLKKVASDRMRNLLAMVTDNRFVGLGVGAFVTVMMQSSSATTVMLVSFVQAGIMSFHQTLAVILGADIGTTITAQLVAFKATDLGIPLITLGFTLAAFAKREDWSQSGQALFGLGLLFYGMKIMIDTMVPLRDDPYFLRLIEEFKNPIVGILFAAAFTALIHSSAAFIGIVVVMAQQGIINLEVGIPLILGSNLGTCITAGMAALRTSREAKRVALAHVGFKLVGIVFFIFWIPWYADLVRWVSAPFGASIAREIANAHTVFNVVLAAAFLPFTKQVGDYIVRFLPDEEKPLEYVPRAMHLNDQMLDTPAMALGVTRKEIARMAKIVQRMVSASIIPFMSNKSQKDAVFPDLNLIEGIKMREEKVDFLEREISNYLFRLMRKELSEEQVNEAVSLISIVNDLESMADIVHREILALVEKKKALEVDFSPEGQNELEMYHIKVLKQLSRLEMTINEMDHGKAQKILDKMEKYLDLEDQLRKLHLDRVRQARMESQKTHEVHMKLMDFLKQINVYSGNIAKRL